MKPSTCCSSGFGPTYGFSFRRKRRHKIGITSVDGYFSMNTGELITAPFLARQLGELSL
jgi:hypothetical protein